MAKTSEFYRLRRILLCQILALSFFLPLLSLRAGVWSAPEWITGDSDVSTSGDLVWAYHFTMDATDSATVNGVTFLAGPYAANLSNNVAFGNAAQRWSQNLAFSGTVPAYTGLSLEYQTVLQGGTYWTASDGFFTLNSLAIGQEYQLQFWVQDARGGAPLVGRTDLLDDGTGPQVQVAYNDGVSPDGSLGQYVFYTFTATGASQLINVSHGPGGSEDTAQVNAMQLRAVPEPSACLLFAGGAMLVLWRMRGRGR